MKTYKTLEIQKNAEWQRENTRKKKELIAKLGRKGYTEMKYRENGENARDPFYKALYS